MTTADQTPAEGTVRAPSKSEDGAAASQTGGTPGAPPKESQTSETGYSEASGPGSPVPFLGWLRGGSELAWPIPIPLWTFVAVSIPLTIGLGYWGFRELRIKPPLTVPESFYRAVKLYTLDLGPAAGGSTSPRPNWQLWVALILAALLVLRGLLALSRSRLQRSATKYLLRNHVVVCGAGVHGTRLVRELAKKHDVVLIDVDPHGLGIRAPHGKYEWRQVGDGSRDETLRAAGAHRANWLIAVTGNDFVNSQIVSAMQGLRKAKRSPGDVNVFVQLEDPFMAGFLEEQPALEGEAGRIVVSPFSANAIAADALIERSPVKPTGSSDEGERLLRMRRGRAPNLLLAGDHPLLDAMVLAALRRWRVRALRDLEANELRRRPPIHVSVFGPGAVDRVEQLVRRWRPEPQVLSIEAKDTEPAGETSSDVEEWLRKRHRADHAIVVCNEELDGVALTLRISRALGNDKLMTRVPTHLESVLDTHLKEWSDRPQHATTDVKSIADLACDVEQMKRLSGEQRLRDAVRGRKIEGLGENAVEDFFDRKEALSIRSDSTWRILPSEQPMLEALVEPVPLSAVVRAGLRVELGKPENLRPAATRLSARAAAANQVAAALENDALEREAAGISETEPEIREREARRAVADERAHHAICAWCQYAWFVIPDSPRATLEGLGQPTGDLRADRLLALRRATLGELEALDGLEPDGSDLAGAQRVAILAGPAGSATPQDNQQLKELLEPGMKDYEGVILSGGTPVGLPGVVGRLATNLRCRAIGYTPPGHGDESLYDSIVHTPDQLYGPDDPVDYTADRLYGVPRPFSIREPLTMWTEILRAGFAADQVRLIVFRGGRISTEELLLARALGAQVAWLDPAGAATAPLADTLPLGDEGVVELPVDRMTIRAFLAPSELSGEQDELRERAARYFHMDYRRKQRDRKHAGDPAMAPWDQLTEALKLSNLGQANDIPNKLKLIGKRLAKDGEQLSLDEDQVELLAEAEHGRWNVERLLGGWQLGERHVGRGLSPDLRSWHELPNDKKEYDREAVRNIAPALAAAGWGVVDAQV